MKKGYLSIILVCLSWAVWGQQQWEWARIFESPHSIEKVFKNTDPQGRFYVSGHFRDTLTLDGHTITGYTSYQYGYKRFLSRFDSTGICDMLINLPDSLSVIETDELGNIYMIRYFTGTAQFESTTFTSQGDYGFYMVKYKPDLTVDWVKQGDVHSQASQRFGITIDHNHDVIASMWFGDSIRFDNQWYHGTGRYNSLIIKLSAGGSYLWHSMLANAFPASMQADKNNDLVFIAHIHDSCYLVDTLIEHPTEIGYYYMVKYKSDGTPERYKELWTCYKTSFPVFSIDNSSNIYVIDQGYYSPSTLIKYDTQFNQLWYKWSLIYSGIFIDKYDRIFVSGIKMDDAMACNDTIPEETCAYGQIDSSGNCIWYRTLPTLDDDHWAGVAIATAASYTKLIGMGGNNVPFALDNISIPGDTFTEFLAGMNINGMPSALAGNEEQASSLNIYPNPAGNVLHVDHASGSIIIRDVTGREVYRKQNASLQETIKLGNFSNGIYLVEVSDEKSKTCKKLMVQK